MMTSPSVTADSLRTRSRIAAHAIWDNLVKPPAYEAEDVPWHGEAITAQWLTAVLCKDMPGAAAAQVEVTGGDDGSSVRRALRVTWNAAGKAAGLPEYLFAKSTPTLATRLSAGMAAPAEGYFLQQIRPQLPLEAPVCLYSARDTVSGRSLHLMEDLTFTRGARFCSGDTEINQAQARDIFLTLASLHGPFMGKADSNDVPGLNTYEDFFNGGRKSGIQHGHEQALDKAADIIPSALMERRDDIWRAAVKAAEAHSEEPRTLLHSDVHLGNWYVTSDGRMGLSDWARVCRGLWARDVAYALATTLSTEDRRAWENDLLNVYLAALADHGTRIGSADAWQLVHQQFFTALLMWTPTLCPPPSLPDMQPEEMSRNMIQRICAAIDDHQALDSF